MTRAAPQESGKINGSKISKNEIDFFKTNGFLVKKKLLSTPRVLDALNRSWNYLLESIPLKPGEKLRREDRKTWVSPKWKSLPPAATSGFYQGRQPIVYQGPTVKLHELGSAKFLVDLLPNCREVRSIAECLLGTPLRTSRRTRGVYANFPSEPYREKLGPHSDQVCQQLNVCTYLDDVPPRNGGFTVYPGSHRVMHHAHKYEANWSPVEEFGNHVRVVVREIEPYEFVGEAGDVIFWHGRLIHSAGIHTGDRIRWAVFADFSHDRTTLSEKEHRQLGQYEWYKDTQLFKNDLPVTQDMWRSWNV